MVHRLFKEGIFSIKAWFFVSLFLLPLSAAQDTPVIELRIPADGSTTPDTRPSDNPLIQHISDSSIPAPTLFSWSAREYSASDTFAFSLSEDTVLSESGTRSLKCIDTLLRVWNLKINTAYFWKISVENDRGTVYHSEVFSFSTPDAWPRMLYVDGTTNVRDIGGMKNNDGIMIRQGFFYRSAEFNGEHTVSEKGIDELVRLGIVSEIDLRSFNEQPQSVLPSSIRYFHPVDESGGGIIAYAHGLLTTPALYREVFRILADSGNYPLICHCSAGLDRAGTVAALLEALLGCSSRQMGDDYQWSALSVNGMKDTSSAEWRGTVSCIESFDEKDSSVQAGAWYYLQTIGMSVDELIAIRKVLIGDDRQPFPELRVRSNPAVPRRLPRGTLLKCITNLTRNTIPVTYADGPIILFDISGKKIRELTGNRITAKLNTTLGLMPPAVRLLFFPDDTKE